MPSIAVLALVATIVICLVAIAWSWLRHRRGHGPRVLVRGIGVVAFLVGLFLSGLTTLAGNGIRSIVDWAQRTHLGLEMEIGFGLLALGVILFVVGSIIKPRTRDEARAVREQRRSAATAKTSGTPAVSSRPAAKSAAGADEDDEVAAILRDRGIE